MIIAAAILLDGVVYSLSKPARHSDIIKFIGRKVAYETQGFLTTENKFVDRIEGAKIAIESGQISKLKWPPNLYSEDLW